MVANDSVASPDGDVAGSGVAVRPLDEQPSSARDDRPGGTTGNDNSTGASAPGGAAGTMAASDGASGAADAADAEQPTADPGEEPVQMDPPTEAPFVEDHRAECTIPAMPVPSTLQSIPTLPDPFLSMDGTRVTTRQAWRCRREEIAALLEHFELGEKPRAPEAVEGSLSGSTLAITVRDLGKSITFTVKLTKPAGEGPFPAIIGYGRVNLGGALAGMPVATIDYTAADIFDAGAPNQMAKDGANLRGQGLFYDLYGRDHSAGTLIAWAWGVSRIIDALAAHPEFGIGATRIAVTGCSRFGKGALVAGAFDQRIALTIPEEGGSGGCSSWRGIAYMKAMGEDIEQLSNVAGGTNWYRSSFARDFTDATVNQIPFDHHELAGLVAPRGLLNMEQDGIAWLGPGATYINNMGTREVFAALSATEAHTYSLTGGHTHCTLPASQHHWVQSYVTKFLLDGEGEPAAIEAPAKYSFDTARWIDWTTPQLQ